jgi:hypothetical protein
MNPVYASRRSCPTGISRTFINQRGSTWNRLSWRSVSERVPMNFGRRTVALRAALTNTGGKHDTWLSSKWTSKPRKWGVNVSLTGANLTLRRGTGIALKAACLGLNSKPLSFNRVTDRYGATLDSGTRYFCKRNGKHRQLT